MTTATLDKVFAEQKPLTALRLVEALLSGEWPYTDSVDAINVVKRELKDEYDALSELDVDADPKVITAHCKASRSALQTNAGILGFVLRSSNVRNAFEIYDPIKRMGEALLGQRIKVVVGSEWSYSPFVYPIPHPALENYILVGLPASEAQN